MVLYHFSRRKLLMANRLILTRGGFRLEKYHFRGVESRGSTAPATTNELEWTRISAGAPQPGALDCGGKRSATPLFNHGLEEESGVAAALCHRSPNLGPTIRVHWRPFVVEPI